MGAIPIPDAAPAIALPSDDEQLRRLISQTGAQAEAVRPMAVSNRGIAVTPQTPGRAIPINRATGAPEELNNQGKPIAPGIAGLWAKADNIHNPFLRALGKIGAVGARAIDVAGSVAAPGVMAQIPGTALNQKVEEATANKNRASDTENEFKQAQTANVESMPEAREAKAELEQEKQNEVAEKNADQDALGLRKLGLKKDASGQIMPLGYEEMSPTEQAAHDLKEAQKEATDARAQLDQMRSDPNSPLYQVQLKRLQVAQQNAQNATARLGLSTAQFQNKLQEQELVKPSGQTQSRGSAAKAALDLIPALEAAVKAHGDEFGPMIGRLNRGEIAIGNVPPDVAQIYTEMESFNALQPAIHGFRAAEFVKDWKTALGSLERNPQAFIAGLEGLRPTLESVEREGKTFHHRVVEGRDVPQQSNEPPRPANVPAGYVFKENGPKGRGWYKP